MAAEVYAALLLLHFVAAGLVLVDAHANSSQSEVLWALVVLVAGFLLGTLLYVLLGRDGGSGRRRPRGHNSATDDDEPMNVDDGGPF